MAIPLRELPFDVDALEPHISAETVRSHHGHYQARCVAALNALLEGGAAAAPPVNMPLLEIVLNAREGALFDRAADVWNHEFYWNSLRPGGSGVPVGALARAIADELGSQAVLTEALVAAAAELCGAGWVWLVVDRDRLRVTATRAANTPFADGLKPLLAIDVWEHAYWLDYRDRREEYVQRVAEHLLHWRQAEENYRRVTGREA